MKKVILVLLVVLSTFSFGKTIGIMGAMESEIATLKGKIQGKKERTIAGITYYTGKLEGKDIVLLKSGIGKVNSAVAADILIREFDVKEIIFTGVAGAINDKLDIMDVVISTDLAQHDYDTTVFGSKLGAVPGSKDGKFFADKKLVEKAYNSAVKVLGKDKVYKGTIVTGDQFIADKKKVKSLETNFGAWAVEMEGAAVAHVATLHNIPFVVIRSMSDKADGSAHMAYEEFEVKAAEKSVLIVKEILK